MPKKPWWYPKGVASAVIPARVVPRQELEARLSAAYVPEAVRGVLTRTSMYVADVTLASVVSFLDGYDAATHGGALAGFREWLLPRINGEVNNQAWFGLIEFLSRPAPRGTPKTRREEIRISQLAELVAAFYAEVNGGLGLRGIFLRYEEWLETRTWYDERSPGWVDVNLRRRRRKPETDRSGRTRARRAKKN